MINYLKKKFQKYKAKRKFSEYAYQVVEFNLPEDGRIKYAQWLNPLERPKQITQQKVNFFRKFIKSGDFAIDIGAHTGDTTIPMGLAAGKQGKILALDPNPFIFKILEANCSLNRDKINIYPLCSAATVADGEFYYSSSEASFNNGGISAVHADQHGKFSMSAKVKGVNLENYLDKNFSADLHKLSLIKVDTEGYDKEVLKSIANLLSRYRPYIICECFGKLTREEREDLFDSIAKHGYDLFFFADFEEGTDSQPLTKEALMNWKHFDIYAVPQGRFSVTF